MTTPRSTWPEDKPVPGGIRKDFPHKDCPYCLATGKVVVMAACLDGLNDGFEDCLVCEGTGRIPL